MHVFIGVSANTYMNIYVCTMFKKRFHPTRDERTGSRKSNGGVGRNQI
jgi:hypothetical protein